MSSTRDAGKPSRLTAPRIIPNLQSQIVEDSLSSKKHRITSKDLLERAVRVPACSLFSLLALELPHIERDSWGTRAEFGGLYLNGERIHSDRALPESFSIEYYEPKYDYSDTQGVYPEFRPEHIVYEDAHLAVVYKPMGIPTHPNKEQGAFSLRTSLEEHYKRKVHLPSRLDTSTAGLIPVSIHGKMHAALQHLFQRRLVKKQYLCEISLQSEIEENVTYEVHAPIRRSPLHAVLREAYDLHSEEHVPESSQALTYFGFIPAEPSLSCRHPERRCFVQAIPITGRTHQIRVHLAYFFGPIVGDRFYGGLPSETLHLMCQSLTLFHPLLETELTISVPDRLCPTWALPHIQAKPHSIAAEL